MNLVQLLYSSVPVEQMGSGELLQILEPARRKNERNDVTGMLAYSGAAFLQVLEGDRRVVSRLFSRIAVDKRHRDVELIGMLYPSARQFAAWTMGFAGFELFNQALVEKHSATGELNGSSLRPESALALLTELAEKDAQAQRAAGR